MIRYDENMDQAYGIKLLDDRTVEKSAHAGSQDTLQCVKAIVNHFIQHPDRMVVPVYQFEDLSTDRSKWGPHPYRYTMKRMGMLDSSEKTIIYLMRERDHYRSKLNPMERERLAEALQEHPSMEDFIAEVIRQGRYHDLHDGNVMKDEEENYHLIDLEGFLLTPLDRKENDWLRE